MLKPISQTPQMEAFRALQKARKERQEEQEQIERQQAQASEKKEGEGASQTATSKKTEVRAFSILQSLQSSNR